MEAQEVIHEEIKQVEERPVESSENVHSRVSQNEEISTSPELKPQRKESGTRANWWEEERKYFSAFLLEQEQLRCVRLNDRNNVLSHQYLISSALRVFLAKMNKALEIANGIKLAAEKQASFCGKYLDERKRTKEKQSEMNKILLPNLDTIIQSQERGIKQTHKGCMTELSGISQSMQGKISEGIEVCEILANKKKELTEFQNIVKHLKQAVQAIEQSQMERERDIKRSGALIGPHTPEDLFIKMKAYASLFSEKLSTYGHFVKAVIEFLYSAFSKYDEMMKVMRENLKKYNQLKAKLYGVNCAPQKQENQTQKVMELICSQCSLQMKVETLEDLHQAMGYKTPRVDLSIFVIKHDTLKTNFKQAANWQPRQVIATHSRYLYVFAPESSGKWEARFDMRVANLRLGAPDQENRELIFQINQEEKDKNILSSWFSGKPTKLFVETRSVDNLIEWVHALTD